jgi:hypothetical protein
MDFDKVDRIYRALSATLRTAGTEEVPTPEEALPAAMRMFSHLVAAYVAGTEAGHTEGASDVAWLSRLTVAMRLRWPRPAC